MKTGDKMKKEVTTDVTETNENNLLVHDNLTDEEIHHLYSSMNKDAFKANVRKLEELHDALAKKDGDRIDSHKTKLKSDKALDRKTLTVGYFGSQGRFYVPFLTDYFENVLKKPITFWAEAPAGSNSISYGMYKYGIDTIATCDKNYWSNSVSKSVIENKVKLTEDELEELFDVVMKSTKKGYILSSDLNFKFNDDVSLFIDNLVLEVNKRGHSKYKIVIALLGKFLMTNATFRSMGWDKGRMVNPDFVSIKRIVAYIRKHNKIFGEHIIEDSEQKVISFWGDFFDFLEVLDPPKEGSIMYSDFAWPWHGGGVTDTYTWYISEFAPILKGEAISPPVMWSKDNIKVELLKFTKKAVDKFEYFFLSTQSSNYPSIEVLKDWVSEVAIIEDYYFIDTRSMMANKGFREELLVLKKK